MKFGIYVRSIGERTEKLCLESCYQHIDPSDVYLIKNYFPSYNAYREMFSRALKSDYNWFLAVDADVVLLPKWYELVKKRLKEVDPKTTFKFTFRVYDPICDALIDRGNHVYNNAFVKLALNALKKNILISKLPFFKRFFNRGYYLKPETSIRGKLLKTYNLLNFNYPEVIGIHGTEQYFSEVFRRFLVRVNRNPEYVNKYDFLRDSNQERLLRQKDIDRYVANLGWNYGMKHPIEKVDAEILGRYRRIVEEKGIVERDELKKDSNWLYDKYHQNLIKKGR